MRAATTLVVLLSLLIRTLTSVAAYDDGIAFLAGAERQYAAAAMPPSGIGYLQVTVHVLASPAEAEAALPKVETRLRTFFATTFKTAVNRLPSSTMDIGDETQAFTLNATVDGTPVSLLVTAWRDGPLVYTAASAALLGDQVGELTPILASLEGRAYQDTPVRIDPATEMRTGGAWDLLPDLQDLPDGFALQREIPLEPAPAGIPTVSR